MYTCIRVYMNIIHIIHGYVYYCVRENDNRTYLSSKKEASSTQNFWNIFSILYYEYTENYNIVTSFRNLRHYLAM